MIYDLSNALVRVEVLTEEKMNHFVNDFVLLDQVCFEEMGERFCALPWGQENYARNLPGKWKLSQVAIYSQGGIAGVWIATNTVKKVCHIHRVLVSREFQGKGVANNMFQKCLAEAKKLKLEKMTLEVSYFNEGALKFYKEIGFSLMSKNEIQDYLDSRSRSADIFDNYLQEKDGSKYYVLKRNIE